MICIILQIFPDQTFDIACAIRYAVQLGNNICIILLIQIDTDLNQIVFRILLIVLTLIKSTLFLCCYKSLHSFHRTFYNTRYIV